MSDSFGVEGHHTIGDVSNEDHARRRFGRHCDDESPEVLVAFVAEKKSNRKARISLLSSCRLAGQHWSGLGWMEAMNASTVEGGWLILGGYTEEQPFCFQHCKHFCACHPMLMRLTFL